METRSTQQSGKTIKLAQSGTTNSSARGARSLTISPGIDRLRASTKGRPVERTEAWQAFESQISPKLRPAFARVLRDLDAQSLPLAGVLNAFLRSQTHSELSFGDFDQLVHYLARSGRPVEQDLRFRALVRNTIALWKVASIPQRRAFASAASQVGAGRLSELLDELPQAA